MTRSLLATAAALALLAAVPAFAQDQTNAGPGKGASPAIGTASPDSTATTLGGSGTSNPMGNAMGGNTSMPNPVLTSNGEVRASKLIGASVYNDHNEKIGSVDDVLMSKDNKATGVIVSVGGFLGIGSKLVQVPYDRLQFNEKVDSSSARIVMPGASRDALTGMPTYH